MVYEGVIEVARYPTLGHLQAVAELTQDGCLIWQRALDSGGYGSLRSKGRTWRAHELAWFLAGRARPKGYTLHHLCHNRACVLVTHLVCITRAEHWEITKAEFPGFWDKQRASSRALRRNFCKRGHDDWYEKPSGGRQCLTCQKQWHLENKKNKKG